jgi:superfamily II DNA or RNA helicase
MIQLRDYQTEILNEILFKIPQYQKICVQLSTGGGKTVIFTELVNQLNDKTLILVDSIDLIKQTYKTFRNMGVDIGCLTAGTKIPHNQVIVAMVETLWNRRHKMPDFKYCIVDECHVWIFNKLFPYLKNAKIIGFTATPSRLKRYKLDDDYTAQECMADVYDTLIVGKPIEWLMQNKYLVRDENILFDFDASGLKTDASGEFTASSLKEVFQRESYQEALRKTYDTHADNKKTMIFTSSTETNAIYAELFKDKNVRTYDSVNNKPHERDQIVNWFTNTPDAILINTGCFTKGFDVCDVEVIIVARATKSLSLWIQICGRGARPTKKIEKPSVLIIDGGNNIQEHGIFSFNRDWNKIFSDRKIKAIIEPQQECNACGFTFPEKEKSCPNCGEPVPIIEKEIEQKDVKEFKINGQKLQLKPPIIDINFFLNKGATDYEALKVLREKWINFLVKSEIKKETFDYHLKVGTFDQKFKVLLKPYYLLIIRSPLKKGKNVVYKNFTQKILETSYNKKYNL